MELFKLLHEAMKKGKGIFLVPTQLEQTVQLILQLNEQSKQLAVMLEGADQIITRYVQEHGDAIILELQGDLVEGEVVADEETDGDNEVVRVDSPSEEEE